MKNRYVITINREYGSGGRTIGEMLSEDLGVHYYDKEILKLASDDSGINEALFVNADVKFKGSSLFKTARTVYSGKLIPPQSSGFTSEMNLFNYQAKIIKKLCDTEACVIVGRCAGFILADRPNVVRIFVHAPLDYRLKSAAKQVSLAPRELERYVERINRKRAEYFSYYTGEKWDDAHNYDLCLDSSNLGYQKCVDIIKGYMKVRFGENVFD